MKNEKACGDIVVDSSVADNSHQRPFRIDAVLCNQWRNVSREALRTLLLSVTLISVNCEAKYHSWRRRWCLESSLMIWCRLISHLSNVFISREKIFLEATEIYSRWRHGEENSSGSILFIKIFSSDRTRERNHLFTQKRCQIHIWLGMEMNSILLLHSDIDMHFYFRRRNRKIEIIIFQVFFFRRKATDKSNSKGKTIVLRVRSSSFAFAQPKTEKALHTKQCLEENTSYTKTSFDLLLPSLSCEMWREKRTRAMRLKHFSCYHLKIGLFVCCVEIKNGTNRVTDNLRCRMQSRGEARRSFHFFYCVSSKWKAATMRDLFLVFSLLCV